LKEAGFIDGHNVAIEFRWAENKLDRLPALAAHLAQRHVAVIAGPNTAMRAAREIDMRAHQAVINANVVTSKLARDYTDDELAAIIAGAPEEDPTAH
jgi:hypothetical protein